MVTETNKEVWSKRLCTSGIIWWLLNFSNSEWRNINFITEFKSWRLSVYWVGTELIDVERSILRLSAIS